MARGIYRVSTAAYPPTDGEGNPSPFGDCVVVNPGSRGKTIIASGRCPHPELEALGAELIGNHWRQAKGKMTATQKDESFDMEWAAEDEEGNPIKVRGRRKRRPKDLPARRVIPGEQGRPTDWLVPVCFHPREGTDEQAALDAE